MIRPLNDWSIGEFPSAMPGMSGNLDKRLYAIQALERWAPWHVAGCPPLPNPLDNNIPKRTWEFILQGIRSRIRTRLLRSTQLSDVMLSLGLWDEDVPRPDPFDDALSEEAWSLDLVVFRQRQIIAQKRN